MSTRCALKVCRAKYKNIDGKPPKCYMFPKNKVVRRKWEAWVKKQNRTSEFSASIKAVLCRTHFNQDEAYQKSKLRDDALPTVPPECDTSILYELGWYPQAVIHESILQSSGDEGTSMEVIPSVSSDQHDVSSMECAELVKPGASVATSPTIYTCKHCGNECSDVQFLNVVDSGAYAKVPVVTHCDTFEGLATNAAGNQKENSDPNGVQSAPRLTPMLWPATSSPTAVKTPLHRPPNSPPTGVKTSGAQSLSKDSSHVKPSKQSVLLPLSTGINNALPKTAWKLYAGDPSPGYFETPRRSFLQSSVLELRSCLRHTQMCLNRSKRKVRYLDSLLSHLKETNPVNQEILRMLETRLLDLPDELLLSVLALLDPGNLCAVGHVCSRLRRISKDERLWEGHKLRVHSYYQRQGYERRVCRVLRAAPCLAKVTVGSAKSTPTCDALLQSPCVVRNLKIDATECEPPFVVALLRKHRGTLEELDVYVDPSALEYSDGEVHWPGSSAILDAIDGMACLETLKVVAYEYEYISFDRPASDTSTRWSSLTSRNGIAATARPCTLFSRRTAFRCAV